MNLKHLAALSLCLGSLLVVSTGCKSSSGGSGGGGGAGGAGGAGGQGGGGEGGGTDENPPGTGSTPLVLSFDGAQVEFTADAQRSFDLDGTRSQATDWPTARTPWLALDRDGNGRIDDGSELFGSMTVLSSGQRASNGFQALKELDTNGDGQITAADAGFSKLVLWSDRDGDRRSSAGELMKAADAGLVSIDLEYSTGLRCDARNNCEVERASFRFRDANGVERTGLVLDVHLPAR